jgi:putative DeoR family transcriptional regulator (stage III sporulation protein D)
MTERLPSINKQLAVEIKRVLDQNKAERHLRGGEATKKKYLNAARLYSCSLNDSGRKFI